MNDTKKWQTIQKIMKTCITAKHETNKYTLHLYITENDLEFLETIGFVKYAIII